MKRDILILSALCTCCNLFAEEITVKYLRYAGPYEIKSPFIVDSLDVNSKKFTDAEYNPQNQKSRFQKRKIKKNGKRFVDSLYSLIDLKTI